MRRINEIIVHCTATRTNQSVTMADINRWHKERGFAKVGYHYVIDVDGSIMIGRDESETGAHCVGHNANSIGIAYIGGLCSEKSKPKDTRTQAQKDTLKSLIILLCDRHPIVAINGHSVYANKDCPCFDAKSEYLSILK